MYHCWKVEALHKFVQLVLGESASEGAVFALVHFALHEPQVNGLLGILLAQIFLPEGTGQTRGGQGEDAIGAVHSPGQAQI